MQNFNIKILGLDDNLMPQKTGKTLASIITHNTVLEELHLSNNNLGIGLLDVAKALQKIQSLQVLNLSNTQLPNEVNSDLALAIESNRNLKTLLMSSSSMECSSDAILPALSKSFSLQIMAHSCNLQSSINLILQALSKLSTLEQLDLHNSHLTSLAAKGIESVIKNNTGLQCLYINDNNLGKGLIIILKALKSISSLKQLNIDNNNFMNDVIDDLRIANKVRVFLDSLFQCSDYSDSSELLSLKKLCIASKLQTKATLVEEAEIALASSVQNNPGIQVLHVDNGCLHQPPKQFIKALKYANSIKVLDLSNFNLSEEKISELTSSIKSYTSLEMLYLYNNNLKTSVIILSEVLATISTLKVLDL